ncbi:MAG: hypothetical protein P1U63_12165 [Coxiellaceae bacterium]|nr:hypothetical protein [Coxiellaceae bacterium]
MLAVKLEKQPNGNNHPLQAMSDQIAMLLSPIRNKHAPMPSWVRSMTEKKKAFDHYGSPNVFFEFSPHFSILAKNFTDRDSEKSFQQQLFRFVQSHQQAYARKRVTAVATEIGVGVVNSFGQVTKVLTSFPLRGPRGCDTFQYAKHRSS